MKATIEPKAIRKGDLIRKEYGTVGKTEAIEYRADAEGDGFSNSISAAYFLLDRPVPPVILPTEPGAYRGTYSDGEPGSLYVLDADGIWHDFSDSHATSAVWKPTKYAPLTKLEPVAETAKRVIERMASWWEFGPPKKFQDEFNDIAAEFGVK